MAWPAAAGELHGWSMEAITWDEAEVRLLRRAASKLF
jgi:hypothetical protein